MDIFDDNMSDTLLEKEEMVILSVSNAYSKKYYLNPIFGKLPEGIREELQILCVLYTEDVGGILTLRFDEQGNLLFHVTSEENDYYFDEIGSVLKIKQIQREKKELLESLEMYYRAFFLKEDISALLEDDGE